MFKRKPLTPAEIKQRSEAGKASGQARHRAETSPSVTQGSTGAPSKQAVGLFRQGQARADTRAARSVWDTRATEPPVGAFNATAKIHFPKAYRSKTPLPGLSRQAKLAALRRAKQSRGTELTITNPEALLEAHRHPEMMAILKNVEGVLRGHQDGTIERGTARGLIPEGTHPGKAVRAYKHAALRALHKAGLIDYTTQMDEAAKEEFRPLVPFMRYAARRVFDKLNTGELNGKWHPFRDEFGQLYRQKKHGKLTGHERMRMRPEDQFIKQWLDGTEGALTKALPPPTDNNPKGDDSENKNVSRYRDTLPDRGSRASAKNGRRWTHYNLLSHPSSSGMKDNPLGPVDGTSHPSIPHMPGGGSLKQAVDQVLAQVPPIAGTTRLNPVTKLYEVQDRPNVQKQGAELNMTALNKVSVAGLIGAGKAAFRRLLPKPANEHVAALQGALKDMQRSGHLVSKVVHVPHLGPVQFHVGKGSTGLSHVHAARASKSGYSPKETDALIRKIPHVIVHGKEAGRDKWREMQRIALDHEDMRVVLQQHPDFPNRPWRIVTAYKKDRLQKDFGFLNYNEDPNRQLNRAMRPRIRRRLPRLRLNTQRHLKRLLNGGVTRQERWQLGLSLGKAAKEARDKNGRWTTGQKAAVLAPVAFGGALGVNAGLVEAVAQSRNLSALKAAQHGGGIAAGVALTASLMAVPLSIAIHDVTALAHGHRKEALLSSSWRTFLEHELIPGIIGGAVVAFHAPNLARGLANQAKAAPKAANAIAGKLVPAYGRHVKAAHKALLREVRERAKSVDGTLVFRGAPTATDFAPKGRDFNAVYVARSKRITDRYGADQLGLSGSVSVYRLHPQAKLLNTDVRLPEHAGKTSTGHNPGQRPLPTPMAQPISDGLRPLFDKLIGPEKEATNQTNDHVAQVLGMFGVGPQTRDYMLQNLHWAPTDKQIEILREHGYHGTIGPAKNIALHEDGLLTPLYAQSRYHGGVKLAPKPDLRTHGQTIKPVSRTQIVANAGNSGPELAKAGLYGPLLTPKAALRALDDHQLHREVNRRLWALTGKHADRLPPAERSSLHETAHRHAPEATHTQVLTEITRRMSPAPAKGHPDRARYDMLDTVRKKIGRVMRADTGMQKAGPARDTAKREAVCGIMQKQPPIMREPGHSMLAKSVLGAGLKLGRKAVGAVAHASPKAKGIAGGLAGGAVAAKELHDHPRLRHAAEGAAVGAGAVALAARGNLGLLRRGTRAMYQGGLHEAMREHVRVAEGATPSPHLRAAAQRVYRAAKKHSLETAQAERAKGFAHLKRTTANALPAAALAGGIGAAASQRYTAAPLYQLAATPAGDQSSPYGG